MTSFTINVNSTGDPRDIVRAIQKYNLRQMQKPTRPDEDGSAGVAAMVPAGPDRGDGGMYVDEPA